MDGQRIELPNIPGIVLSEKQKYDVTQVIATMRLSGFPVGEEEIKNLILIAAGVKSADESIRELDRRYDNS